MKKYPEKYENIEYKRLKILQIALAFAIVFYTIPFILSLVIESNINFVMGGLMITNLIILSSLTIRIKQIELEMENSNKT